MTGFDKISLAWTAELGSIDSVPHGAYRKYVLPCDARVGSASIVHPDGARLRFSWPTETVPYLAVYLERQAFTTQACIALEPMTGWYDDLSQAVAASSVAMVGVDPLTWTLIVDVEETG